MSKTEKKKKRGTRMTGTDTRKPCVDCGKMKDRFKSFRPRWAACVNHKGPNGRRAYHAGCSDCEDAVNSNIRQPRCIDCDAKRPKKRKKAKDDAKPTTVEQTPEPVAAVNVDPNPTLPPAPAPEFTGQHPEARWAAREVEADDGPVVDLPGATVTPEDVAGLPERVKVEPQDEPAPESVSVPEPKPAAQAKRPAIASMADLSKLFDDEGVDSE